MTNKPLDRRDAVLEVEGVTKRFPGVLANDNVSMKLYRGEILAMLGENGAGKSTLMNIIYGLYHHDEGTIRLKGKTVRFASPREAIHSGIGMVHQHFQLIPVMTVAENVLLGEESTVTPTGEIREVTPADETPLAGRIRLVWGAAWRALLPVVAILVSVLVGYVLHLLTLNLFTYIPTDPFFQSKQFVDQPIVIRAEQAINAVYGNYVTQINILLWLPLVLACLFGAVLTVLMYRNARRTWRGTARETQHKAIQDSWIDALINLLSNWGQVQNQQHATRQVRQISQKFGLELDPDAYIEKLPVGLQQRVEIVKALYRKADILILDEPTAVLTPQETKALFTIMRQLASQGVSIIFITHKLKEVLEVADRIIVMRDGKVVGTTTPEESTEASLAAMMVGRSVMLKVDKAPAKPGEVVLNVDHLAAIDDRGQRVVNDVSFEVRMGEIFGVAGVQGNGQTELVEVLTGLRPAKGGKFWVNGEVLDHTDPRRITVVGTGHVPEDRHRYGMVKPFPVADNLVLNSYYNPPFARYPSWRQLPFAVLLYLVVFTVIALALAWLWVQVLDPAMRQALNLANLNVRREPVPFIIALVATVAYALVGFAVANVLTAFGLGRVARSVALSKGQQGVIRDDDAIGDNAEKLVKEFDIRTPGIGVNGGNLSGGNQQKMVVARELSRRPRLLIASQPTRGIDVGSIEFIHNRLVEQRDAGAAVLLVSAELDEIMALSDRIAVMYKGQIVAILPAETATREDLGLLMAGAKPEPKSA